MPSTSFPAGTVTLGNNKTWARAGMFLGFACPVFPSYSIHAKKSTLRIPSSATKAFILQSGNGTAESCSET